MSAYPGVIDLPAPSPAAGETVASLVAEIRTICPRPVDVLQVAALLETAGVTDGVARQRYGCDNVFELAEDVALDITSAGGPAMPHRPPALPDEARWQAAMDYLRGPLALVPMILVSVVILVYQEFGQWSAGKVLALSLSVVGSLLITSGFVQAASRKGSSYLSQGYISAARRIVSIIAGLGLATVCLVAVILAAVASYVAGAPPDAVATMIVGFVVLSCLWLAAGVLFMLNQVHWFGIGLGIGVGLIYAIMRWFPATYVDQNWVRVAATAIGFGGALLVMLRVMRRTLARRAAVSPVGGHRVVLPASPHLVVNLSPYFMYGVLYVVLILAGHVSGWVGRIPSGQAQMVAVTTTEVGLTIALCGMILAGGVAERTIGKFWRLVQDYQMDSSPAKPARFGQSIRGFFASEQKRFALILVLCSCAVTGVVVAAVVVASARGLSLLPLTRETLVVLALGTIGYGIMALGVFQCMLMITLSVPGMANRYVLVGILVTLLVGIAAGWFFGYQYSTTGVVVGSLAFLLTARRSLNQLLRNVDYYYYASF